METQRGISLYWRCQLIGWTMASLYWAYIGMAAPGSTITTALCLLVTDVALYILITHQYRNFARRHQWQRLSLKPLLVRLFVATIVLGALYTAVTLVKVYLFRIFFTHKTVPFFPTFVSENLLSLSITGIRLMLIWLLAYHGYHYALREMRVIKENARLQLALKEAQLQNVYAQINPHFLFNALNTIKALVNKQPASARRSIDLLAELLRTSLYEGDQQETTVEAELAIVKDYVELEQLRLDDRLTCTYSIDASIIDRLVPRLSLITMVENAVKHGISQSKDGGALHIEGKAVEKGYILSVTHPGVLGEGAGIGLNNIRERLGLLYDGKGFFKIASLDGKVEAQLFIPR